MSHILVETGKVEDETSVDLMLECPDCSTTVHLSVEPADEAEHLVASVVTAHRYAAMADAEVPS